MGWRFWASEKSAAEQSLENLQRRSSGPRAGPGPAADRQVSAPSSDFEMPVERVFSITGRGTVVTGVVTAGTVAVGSTVTLHRADGTRRSLEVVRLEMFRRSSHAASTGDTVGLQLDVARGEITQGDVLRA